jgi:membrane protein DedA with SNARE-associated domain
MELWEQLWNALRASELPDLGGWSYLILFILIFVEGPAITMTAGALAGAEVLRFDWVFVVAVVGNTIADYTWYLLGYFGLYHSLPALSRLRWMQQNEVAIQHLIHNIHRQATRLFILTKASFGLMSIPVLMAAGAARVPWWRLFVVSLIFEPIWNAALILAGYLLGDYISHLERGLRIFALIASILLFLLLAHIYRGVFRRVTGMDKILE